MGKRDKMAGRKRRRRYGVWDFNIYIFLIF
jgi:hypothetical protein